MKKIAPSSWLQPWRRPHRAPTRAGCRPSEHTISGHDHSGTLIYYNNVSTVYLFTNPIQHQRTKHVEIDLHFVWERVAIGDVCILHVPTISQITDIFTKGLPISVFSEFRSSLNIHSG
jgi:hypothetical protein